MKVRSLRWLLVTSLLAAALGLGGCGDDEGGGDGVGGSGGVGRSGGV